MEKEIISKVSIAVETIVKDIFKEEKLNTACALNSLAEKNKISREYVRAIDEIKEKMGIKGTVYELFTF